MAQKNAPGTMIARHGEGTLAGRSESALTRWSPWDEFTALRRQMDDLFSRSFGYTPLSHLLPSEPRMFEPDVDIYETDDQVRVFAAVPGYAPDQINVEATNNTLTIQGQRKPLYEDENAKAHRQSWQGGFSQFNVYYTLPAEIDPNRVKATFRNGILELEMPKTEPTRLKGIKVNVQKA